MNTVLSIYVTLMSVIFAGALNMLLTKTKFYRSNHNPIDAGKSFIDGKRIFGDNKTWKGFFGMIVCGAVSQSIWGAVCAMSESLMSLNRMYKFFPNCFAVNFAAGILFGFAYVLFELPNSFIKRRVGIVPGKIGKGWIGVLFFVVDQIDSLLGVVLVLSFMCDLSFGEYWLYILFGFFTHIAVNLILYALKIRKNI